MVNIDVAWDRIRRYAGEEFHTITGLPFTYEVPGNYLRVSRTVRSLSRSNFAKALDLMPATGPGALQHPRGPAYTWAILMNARVRQEDW